MSYQNLSSTYCTYSVRLLKEIKEDTPPSCLHQPLSLLYQDFSVSSFFSCVASSCHHRISSPKSARRDHCMQLISTRHDEYFFPKFLSLRFQGNPLIGKKFSFSNLGIYFPPERSSLFPIKVHYIWRSLQYVSSRQTTLVHNCQ